MKRSLFLIAVTMFGIVSIAAADLSGCSKDRNANIAASNAGIQNSREFKVKPGGSLNINLKYGGDIEIESWNKDVVSIETESNGQKSFDRIFEVEQDGNNLSIAAKRGLSADITVKIPHKFNIEFFTSGGDIKISSVDGKLKGKTMGGDLEFHNLKGFLEITTTGGDITLKDSEVDGKVSTMGGEVLVQNVKGDINASSMGGNIQYINVQGKNKSVGKEVDISTMGGNLIIDKAPNGAKLNTMGGDIKINHADKFIIAETMGGNIEIKSVNGWVKAKTMGGDVEIKVIGNSGDDKKDVDITSKGGDITLTVPAGLSMNIDIEIAYTKKHTNCKIVSDFSINEERTKEWDDENGSPRKFIYGKGSVGGGKNKIIIHTINGNVYLKKG
jgi:hypothetical protein